MGSVNSHWSNNLLKRDIRKESIFTLEEEQHMRKHTSGQAGVEYMVWPMLSTLLVTIR